MCHNPFRPVPAHQPNPTQPASALEKKLNFLLENWRIFLWKKYNLLISIWPCVTVAILILCLLSLHSSAWLTLSTPALAPAPDLAITLSLFAREFCVKCQEFLPGKFALSVVNCNFSLRKGCQPFAQITEYRGAIRFGVGFYFASNFTHFQWKFLGKFQENAAQIDLAGNPQPFLHPPQFCATKRESSTAVRL